MTVQTDENQALNVLHRHDSADRQTRTKLWTFFIDMTVQTDENQALNVLRRYNSAEGREPSFKRSSSI